MKSATRTLASIAGHARLWLALAVLAAAVGLFAGREAAAQNSTATTTLTSAELDELVGPIALYPDDLVAVVLPASTYPLQVVEAARLLEARKSDSSLKPDADWDDSVVALLNYPEVIGLMNDDLDWTYDLGTAVLNQRAAVLDAIQDFRDRAYAAGNLRTDDRQTVTADEGRIAIAPADPEIIYVPYYEPERVVVYQTTPVYHYYPWGYPVYYYPYPVGYTFRTGFFWGVTSAFAIGWDTHLLHVHNHHYHGHPYFGRHYYDPFYVRNNVFINVNVNRGGYNNVWVPQHRYGGRPIVRGREGYVGTYTPRVNRGHERPVYRDRGAPPSRTQTRERALVPRGDANAPASPPTRRQTTERAGGNSTRPSTVTRTPESTYRRTPGGTAYGTRAADQMQERSRAARPQQPTETPRAAPTSPQQRALPRGDNREPAGAAPETRAAPSRGTVPTQPPRGDRAPSAPPRASAPRESNYRDGGAPARSVEGYRNGGATATPRSSGNGGGARGSEGGGYRGGQGGGEGRAQRER